METILSILVKLNDQASEGLSKIGHSLDGLAASTAPAASASKALAVGLAGIGVAAVAGGAIAVNAAQEHVKNLNQLEAVLKSTGGAAGLFKEDILDQADALSRLTNYDDDAILSGQNLLLTFTNIKGPVMQGATQAIVDMSAAMGQDLKSSAIQVGKALNDPVAGISALSRVGVTFSEDQKKVIQSLVDTGQTAKAQQIILNELNREFGGSAEAQMDPIIMLQKSFGDLAKAVGMELLPVVQKLAAAAADFIYNHIDPWIERTKELIKWLKDHQVVIYMVAGAIMAGLIPALIAWAAAMGPVIAAFIASAIALAPWLIGGAIIGGLIYGIIWLIKHWDLVKAKAAEVWQWVVSKFNAMKDAVVGAFDAMAAFVVEIASNIRDWVVDKFTALKDGIMEVLNGIAEFFRAVWDVYIGIWKFAIALIVGLVIKMFNAMGIDIVGVFATIKQFFVDSWEKIKEVFQLALQWIVDTWNRMFGAAKDTATSIFTEIAAAFQIFWDALKGMFDTALAFLSEVWNRVWSSISAYLGPIWESIQKVLTKAWDWMKGIFKSATDALGAAWSNMWQGMSAIVTNVWETIKNTVKNSINWVIQKINDMINAVNRVAASGAGALHLSVPTIPTIPLLAAGGIVTSPTLAMVGEAGPEAVIPLSRMPMFAAAGAGPNIIVNITGNQIASELDIRDMADRVSRAIVDRLRLNQRLDI